MRSLSSTFSMLSLQLPPVEVALQLGGVLAALLIVLTVVHATWKRASLPSMGRRPHSGSGCHAARTLGSSWSNALAISRNAGRMHDWIADKCRHVGGKPFLLRSLGNPDQLVVYTPEAVEDVLKTHFASFPKGDYVADVARDLVGDGIFAADGDKWSHQRKTVSALFTRKALRDSMTRVIQQRAGTLNAVLARAQASGTAVDLNKLFSRFTMETFAEIGFGVHMNCLDADEEHPFQASFDRAQRAIGARFLRPRWLWKLERWLQLGREAQLKDDISVINSTVVSIIERACERHVNPSASERASEPKGDDIVSLFLDSFQHLQQAGDAPVDPMYLRDIVVTFVMAGRDSIAQATSWFFCCLARHPAVEAKIRAEIDAKLSSDVNAPLTMDDVHELVYLESALKETLRLYPSVPFFRRRATSDVVLSDGTFVPANTTVALATFAMARMPFVWGRDAAEFKPERWIDAATGKPQVVSPFKFSAFNAGPRTCVGQNLAMLEMKLLVSGLLRQFRVEVLRPEAVTYDCSMNLSIKGSLDARIHAA